MFVGHMTSQVFLNRGDRLFGDSTETIFGRTIVTTAPNTSDVYRLGIANNEFGMTFFLNPKNTAHITL